MNLDTPRPSRRRRSSAAQSRSIFPGRRRTQRQPQRATARPPQQQPQANRPQPRLRIGRKHAKGSRSAADCRAASARTSSSRSSPQPPQPERPQANRRKRPPQQQPQPQRSAPQPHRHKPAAAAQAAASRAHHSPFRRQLPPSRAAARRRSRLGAGKPAPQELLQWRIADMGLGRRWSGLALLLGSWSLVRASRAARLSGDGCKRRAAPNRSRRSAQPQSRPASEPLNRL